MQTNKNAQCKKCLNKFYQKDIYTIQQFQYKKEPKYKWSVNFFKKLEIGEWDSFCEECITDYSKKLDNAWNNQKTNI
ncbi:MAG: hypothetical protein HOE93_02295 [Nitrosopumilus sp.]|jgi:hypothetical protein|nr:hypothetical protein [Nitrosopumilus sp.]